MIFFGRAALSMGRISGQAQAPAPVMGWWR